MTSTTLSTKVLVRASVISILVVGFAVRVWGANFGLPEYVYHPDEPAIVERASVILRTGEFNPGWFHYPSGYIYVQALSYIVYLLYGAVRGNFAFVPEYTLPQFYLVGRLTTAVFGILTILVVFLIGQKAFRTRVGWSAAALVAFSYLSIVHSHYVTTDIPSTFWVALATLCALLIVQRRQPVWYVLGGLVAGLAASTKYNAGLVLLLILTAHVISTSWGEWGYLDRRISLGLLAASGGFLLGTPYALLDLPTFLNGLGFELNHYNTFQIGYTGSSGVWYLKSVFTSADATLGLAYVTGCIYAIIRPNRSNFLLVIFPIAYFVGLSRTVVHFERNLVPMLPALSVLAAAGLDKAAEWIASRTGRFDRVLPLLIALTSATVAVPAVAAVAFDRSITQLDIRPAAGLWITQNIPNGAKIAVEHYSVPFPRDLYSVTDVLRLWDYDADWYSSQGFDYIVASNGVWLTMLRDSQRYAAELGILQDIAAQYHLVAEFAPTNIPTLAVSGYPTIREYHFAQVWIFEVVH